VNCQGAPEFRGTYFRFIAGIFAIAFSVAATTPHAGAAELQPWTETRPHFALDTITGTTEVLASHRGHPVLVHFFATWCEPCIEELPALRRLVERANGSLRVLAISVAEVDDRVRRFVSATPVNFPVLLDRDRAVAKQWKVDTLPSTYILDAELKPRLAVEADFKWDRIDTDRLAAFLNGSGTLATNSLYRTQ